ncbi:uncharacterized protein LOC118325109 [Morone saxatilis]|uniref:uncharacterized protein LOC118325109 n=1 Tax=Morone saxatilis TaxID=34816 RepID=UPI0015E24713|nr:uncharacterized protein LOC118325109 [Morone saxatilis]
MAKSGRKKSLSFSSFRRRQEAANDRRFCIKSVKGMVNKQVEKRMAELRSEFLLMNHALKEEMVAEFQEQLRELVAEEARERCLHYTNLHQEQRITSRWLRKMEEEYKKKTQEDGEAKSLNRQTLSFNLFESPACTKSSFITMEPPNNEPEESLKILSDVSSDGDTSDVSNVADTSSQPAKCEQQEKKGITSDIATLADTSQVKESVEEEILRNPFHVNPSFMTKEPRCEEERVQVNVTQEDESLLIERQWKEWMDKREMRRNHVQVWPAAQQNTENQGGSAPPVSQKQTDQNVKEVGPVKKLKTYLSDFVNPHRFYRWEKLEDEDS